MTILSTKGWSDYELIDSGKGRRLERFGQYILDRPDPQCIWSKSLNEEIWKNSDAIFQKNDAKEEWINKNNIPEKWKLSFSDISFYARLTPFKHTGIFPEQLVQWEWMRDKIKEEKLGMKEVESIKVLNLFGYTGIASIVCAKSGANVTHVDASKPSLSWARENQEVSGLTKFPIRWILDDALKFCEREKRRGNLYEGIIMDPPIYGHGPNNERWEFFESFPKLLSICKELLSVKSLFFIVNAYAISSSSIMLDNMLKDAFLNKSGLIESGELTLVEQKSDRLLSTGIFSRWSSNG